MLGFAPDAIVVDEEEEWEAAIPRKKRMALISQSTQPPWKFEKLAAFMVVARPRAQDRQHGLPGHDPPPAGHARDGRRGRPDGRRRRPLEREHQGADPAVRDRRHAPPIQIEGVARPDRCRRRSTAPRIVGVTGGTSTPIEDLRDVARADPRDRRHARGGSRRRRARPMPRSTGAATPAGRTTSLPTSAGPPPARRRVRRRLTRGGRHERRDPGRRHRRPPERRQEHALQPDRRPAHGDRRGPRPHDA